MTAEEYFGDWMRVIDKDEHMKVMRWIQTLDDSPSNVTKIIKQYKKMFESLKPLKLNSSEVNIFFTSDL